MKVARLVKQWTMLKPTLSLVVVWSLLNVSANLRFPGPEPDYWYLLPSIDVTLLLLLFACLGACRRTLPVQIRWAITGLFVFLRLLRLGDGFETRYFSTTFNLFMDLPLLPELVRLYYSTAPYWRFLLACLCVTAGILALVWLTHWCISQAQIALRESREIVRFLYILGILVLVTPLGKSDERQLGVFAKSASPRLLQEADFLIHGKRHRAAVLQSVAHTRETLENHPNDLAKLAGANVYLFLIESYGQTVLDRPIFSSSVVQIYKSFESELQPLGFFMASGLLDSPTYGGHSWLAHATLGTGVRTNDQFRYRTVCESRPLTLAHLFRQAGYRTVLAQPATTRPWPQGEFYGFDRKYYAWNFDYKGPAFSWAPMPDQYVLDFIRRKEVVQSPRRLFIQYALVSSHAPWNRQPPLIHDDSKIGDGSIYASRRTITFPTDWSDMSQATDAYIHSIRYDFIVLRRYMATRISDDSLVIILGDHQPNGDITENSVARGVPIHVLSRKKAFVDVFLNRGYVNGMKPDSSRLPRNMADFLPDIIQDFSTEYALSRTATGNTQLASLGQRR